MKHGKWSKEDKKLMVLELLSGKKSVSQICKERGASESLIYRWRDQALKAIDRAFSGTGKTAAEAFEAERQRYLKVIGEQACVIDTLKKISEMV